MIWLIGNKGMLGSAIENMLKASGYDYSATDMNVDIRSGDVLNNYASNIFNINNQHWIINCSAYTAVDKAEDEPELADKINNIGVKNIAACAEKFDAKLIHISTDYVFDGTNPEPITENISPHPVSVYGRTKLDGENAIKAVTNSFFIIRTAWLYGLFGKNFVYTMLNLMNKLDTISVVNDQFGSPTNARNLALLILSIINDNSNNYGIYHYSDEGRINWYEFAMEIYNLGEQKGLIKSPCNITSCDSSHYPTKAARPRYSLLSKEKVRNIFNTTVPNWKDSLSTFFLEFNQINNRTKNWIEHSDYDFETAEAMNNSGRYLYVLITAQQSIEKQLKAVYEYKCKKIPKVHDLLRLANGLELSLTENQNKLFIELSYYYVASRYQERVKKLSARINRTISSSIINETKEILTWLKSMIPFV